MPAIAPILIAACGNPMAGGDAFGHAVATAMARHPIPGVDVIDLGTDPTALLENLPGRQALIIVDAAWWPGTRQGLLLVRDWDAPDRPALQHLSTTSTHGLSIADQIELARQLQVLPPTVRLISVTIDIPRIGEGPDPAVQHQIKAAVTRIQRLVQRLLEYNRP